MKKLRIGVLALLLAFMYGCTQDAVDPGAQTQDALEPMQANQVDATIIGQLEQNDEFNWTMVSDQVVWSVLRNGDAVMSVGYKPQGEGDVSERIHQIDITSGAWVEAKNTLINDVIETINNKRKSNISRDEVVLKESEHLPYVLLNVTDFEVVQLLRKHPNSRYAEPLGYAPTTVGVVAPQNRELSSKGCSNDADNINSADFTTVSPSAKVSWVLSGINVPAAWNHSTGRNITVGLIDTGTSERQAKLGSQFNSGQSTGRYINRFGTYQTGMWWWKEYDGPDDQCGHGTQMAGAILAPRSSGGSSVGAAYNANLVAVRGTSDVVLESSNDKDGVTEALYLLANRSDVKIISMSIGTPFSSGQISDAIRYAYGRGKLMFAAAGTSLTWTSWYGVIFPANMNETVAVTGIKDNGYNRCDVCHDGSKVDFVVPMQRASNTDRTSLTLADSGDQPSYVGGSSVATATTAGVAALVWARNPGWSRETVLQKLKNASDFYPSRNSNFGWGTYDALQAVTN